MRMHGHINVAENGLCLHAQENRQSVRWFKTRHIFFTELKMVKNFLNTRCHSYFD